MITTNKVELRYQMVQDYIHRKPNGILVKQLCSKYQTSRKTLRKWHKRFLLLGKSGLKDRSREPINKPNKTPIQIEGKVVSIKLRNPNHGPRRILHVIRDTAKISATTVYNILVRRGIYKLLKPKEPEPQFYERGKPNQLWHIDIASQRIKREGTLHIVIVEDDYSRKCLACDIYRNKEDDRVIETLNKAFGKYGRPDAILSDNGKQFLSADYKSCLGYIKDIKTRPRNPKCNGKLERLIRTIKEECIRLREFRDIAAFKSALARFVKQYNSKRKHMGIGDVTPDSRYK